MRLWFRAGDESREERRVGDFSDCGCFGSVDPGFRFGALCVALEALAKSLLPQRIGNLLDDTVLAVEAWLFGRGHVLGRLRLRYRCGLRVREPATRCGAG